MSDHTINLDTKLYSYLLNNSLREHDALKQLRLETHKLDNAVMQISPEQGQFMALLVELLGARKTLDIGTFTGYSALAVALALPKDGKVVSLDVDEKCTNMAQSFWQQAGQASKIELCLGPALDSLQALLDRGEEGSFDFIFIDADKGNYVNYYEKSLRLLRVGGLIAIDNVLQDGKVADPSIQENSTKGIRALNDLVLKDARVTISMLPVGDGLTLARKRMLSS